MSSAESVMGQVLFVQGGGKGVHDGWDNKLVDSLRRELGPSYEIHYPRMPNEDDPRYSSWKAAIEAALERMREGAVLVGHSVGAAILVQVLAGRSGLPGVSAVFLVAAPFVGEGGWESDEFQFPEDLGARLPSRATVHLYHGLEDDIVPPSHGELYARAIPHARVEYLPGRDHQLNNDLREVAGAIALAERHVR